MAVNERLKEIRCFLKMTQKEMANILSISQNSYSYIEGGKVSLTDRNRKILIEKLDINPDFLDGKNKRFFIHEGSFAAAINKASANEQTIVNSVLNNSGAEKQETKIETRPRIPYTAAAGSLTSAVEGITSDQCEHIPRINIFPEYDFTIIIKGDSMEPKYEGGDEVACKRIDSTSFIQWGKVHVLDTAQGILIKRTYEDGDKIRCVSYNPEYPDFSIDKSEIYSMSLVVGLVRL